MIEFFRIFFVKLIICGLIVQSASDNGLLSNTSTSKSANETLRKAAHSQVYRKVRSTDGSPFGTPLTCTYSGSEINGLVDALVGVVTQTSDSGSLIATMSPCVESLNEIQRLSKNLVEKFQVLASADNRMPDDEFKKMKAAFENDVVIVQKQIDRTSKRSTQENQIKFSLIDFEMQNLYSKLTTALIKQETDRIIYKNMKITQCIEEIKTNRADAAVKSFSEINEESTIGFIIKSAYAANVNNFDRVMKFCQNLNLDSMGNAYDSLFQAMLANSDYLKPAILVLYQTVDEITIKPIYNSASKSEQNIFKTVKQTMTSSVDNIVIAWSDKIRLGEHSLVTTFAKTQEKALSLHLEAIVSAAYGRNVENVDNLLLFVRNLISYDQVAIVLEVIHNKMVTNHDLQDYRYIKLAVAVENSLKTAFGSDAIKKLEKLKEAFTTGVKIIISDSTVCFKNIYFGEYIYPSGDTKDVDRRYVFTWKPKELEYDAHWTLEPIENGDYFQIKSVKYQEHLYAADKYFEYNKDRRRPFTWISGSTKEILRNFVAKKFWRIEPSTDDDKFYIKNMEYEEYLYAADSFPGNQDGHRRRVFTWQPGGRLGTKSLWKIGSV